MTVSIANLTSRWSNTSNVYTGLGLNVIADAYANGSVLFSIKKDNVPVLWLTPDGTLHANTINLVKTNFTTNTPYTPSGAVVGDMWEQSNTNILYTYITDDEGKNVWVELGPGPLIGVDRSLDGGSASSSFTETIIIDAGGSA